MRKLTLLITSLLCYVGVLHAEALVADGVYTLSADLNKQRGELVAADGYNYPVLDGIDLNGYTGNSTAAKTNGQYWYVQCVDASSNTYYIYNIVQGKYLVNEGGYVNFGNEPYVWTFVTNAKNPDYLNIKDESKTDNNKVWLSSGCGRTASQRPVQWDNNNNDGGALYTFTYVGNYFATPETGKYYKIKGEGELPWLTANTTAGGNVVVSKNEADAAVFLKTENGLQAVATRKYLGYSGGKYTYSDTELAIELRNTGDYLANYSNKYAIVSGGNYMFNNNTDGIVHESSQGLYLPRLWAFTEVEAPAPTEAEVATLAALQAALAADNELPIIITAQIEIPAGVTVELDLNGKTVNSVFNNGSETNHIYALSNKGTLTINDSKGNGSINSRGIYNYGSLTLNAGAINAIDGNGGYAVNNQSGSTFVMNGGVVAATIEDDHQSSSGGYDATALKVPAGCTATLNGGTINNVCDFTYAIDAAGTLNIPETSAITVNGTHGAIAVSGGVTTIDAGTFQIPADNYSRTDNVLYVSGGSLVVNGGTFIGDSDTAGGGSCLYDAAGKAVVNGGTFKGSSGGDVWGTTGTTIKGGTFENLTEKQHIAAGYELGADGTVVAKPVAQIGETTYTSIEDAIAAAQAGSEIKLLADVAAGFTVPAGVTFNGNDYTVGGVILAAGDITFAGVTKAADLDFAVGNTVVNIPAGASLQLNGSNRMSIGFGTTFNITGTIENAKTADKATLTPSLVIPGASFTGAGVTFNVTNAYISVPSSYCSTSKSASGTFDFNITNSIWESAGKLAFEEQSVNAKVDFALVNSVLTTGSHLVFGTASGEEGVVIDNSYVNKDTSRQLENCGTMTIKNGSVVNGAVATSSNAKNPGTIIVEDATYAVTGEFSGSDLGTGTLIIKKGANVSVGSIKAGANVTVDAEGMAAGDEINFTANLSQFTGELSVIHNDKLEAKIVDGKIVLATKPVAKIGEQGYATLDEAVKVAKVGDKITLLDDADLAFAHNPQYNNVYASEIDLNGKTMTIKKGDVRFDNVTIKNGNIIVQSGTYNGTAIFLMYSKNLTFDGVKVTATGVASTYLIGLEGTSNLNLLNGSEIVINNESLVNIGSIIADNGNGNTVTIKDSKIEITNSNARLYLGGANGKITVENSDIDLNGVKEGFYLRAGQTLAITGTSTVDITLNNTEGRYGINLTDITATYTKAETATVNATLYEVTPAAVIGEKKFVSLADALAAAATMTGDVTVVINDKVTLNQALTGSYSSIKFVGNDTDAEIYLDVQGYITAAGKKVAFEGLTLSKSQGGFIGNAGFMNVAFGVYEVAEVTYTNCTFANGAYAAAGNVTFTGCTFKKSWDKYGLWAYGNVDVTVQGSTFADYRGIKMYAENGAAESVGKANLTVKNTNFSAVDNKPAIVLTYGESVVLEGNTYSSTGTFELDLDGKPNGVAVTSDVAPVCVNDNGACGVLVDGKIYTTVAQAAEVATETSTVTLLHSSDETVEFPMGTTIDKNGFTADNVTTAQPFAEYVVLPISMTVNNYKALFGTNTVTDGTNYYATLQAAVEAIAKNAGVTRQANAVLYCKPGADVGSLQHAPVVSTLTIYGNGANVTGGSERDFDLGNTDPSGGRDITADMTLTVKHLNGCGAWGAKATNHTVNLVFENCANMGKVFITGTTGTLNITMNDCAFEGVLKEAVYSNADGAITLNNVAFSNLNKAINLNHKADGTQTVTINGCSFTNCGADVAADQIPVRVLSSVDGGKTVLNVSNATFTGTPEGGADILLDYGVGETTASVTATAANVFVEKENNVATKTTVTESEGGEFTNVVPVAKVNGIEYMTLAQAVAAVEDGGTITLIANETFTKNNRYNNGGWWDGLGYSGDKSFTIDLCGFTVSQNGALNDYLIWLKNDGAKANTITLKNGTLDAGTSAYCALATASSNVQKITVNLENIQLINNNSNGATLKIRGGAELNANAGTIITGKNSYVGIEAVGAKTVVNIYEGTKIYQNGKSSSWGCLAGASGNSTINVYGGEGTSAKGGFIAMTSGGTINISGGEWTANTDGTIANDNNGVLIAQSDKQYNAGAGNSVVNVTGGTFKGGYNCYGNKAGDAQINIKGGNFNANPESYVAEDYIAVENNGVWNVVKAAAKVGDKKYATLDKAFKAATSDCTIEILSDVTVDYNWDARSTGGKFTVPVTINGNGKTIKFTASVNDNNYQAPFRFEADATVKNLTIDMSEVTDNRFRAISSKGNLTVDGCKFIGKDETLNCRAIIFGEGAGANTANLAISITNSEFISWKRGITDNENGQDVKTATITGNTLENAAVYVSAYENVTFTGNTVEGAYVDIRSYTANSSLNVTATGNTLEENTDTAYNYIKATGNIDQEGFKVYAVAKIGDVEYTTIEKAYAALQEGDEIVILKKGSYALKVKNNVTITGAVAGVEFANIGAFGCNGANVTFNNVTFTYAENSTYKGLQHSGNLVYNNCIFNGQVFLYGQSETFNGCTFNTEDSNNYNVWTYGAKNVAFNECTFNSAGKSVLIYAESASITNNVTVSKSEFIASQAVEGKAAIEMDSSLSGAINLTIDGETTATGFGTGNVSGNSLWNNKKGNNDVANNDITVKVGDTVVLAPIFEAQIGDAQYRFFQDAINAVHNGETITVLRDIATNVEIKEKDNVKVTIDGNGMKMTGAIKVVALSSDNDRRITIKNFKFEDTTSASVDFITSVETNHYPRITVEGCTFTGSGDATDVALRLKSSKNVEIKNCTGTGLHSFIQNTSGWNLTIEGVTVTDSKSGFALGTVQGVTVKGANIDVAGYGIRMDAQYNNNAVIESNTVKAFIPVVVRKAEVNSDVTVKGTNTMTATNTDGLWMAVGTSEYETNGSMPTAATGQVVVTLNDTNLNREGIYGNALAGKGTEAEPFLIHSVKELEAFRSSVNAGETKYNAPGVWVALAADIDLANAEWTVGIGDGHNYSFDGNFDGKNKTIKNLNIKPYADADKYLCGGLFGYIYGGVTIKDLVIENVTITAEAEGHNVGILVGFANNNGGKANISNITVKGDVKVNAPNAYGVGAIVGYSYREMGAITNCQVVAKDGSYIKGQRFVGGITGYSYNNAVITGCIVKNLAISGAHGVAGIAGLALNGNKITNCTVETVTVEAENNVAYIVGELQGEGGDVTVANNNAPQPWVGGSWGSGESLVATIGTQYFTTIAKAIEAAKAGDVISLIADVTASDIITINKAITLDGNGKTLTSTATRAINVDCEGNVAIKNLTINASGERAINVITKPANVTIENVTATAANYTVNVAASAGAAKVAITGSNLTGLNVVNVASAGAQVTIDNSTVNCNDNNTTAGESYAALCLNKAAVGASIVATNTTVNVTDGSDSTKGRNGAENGTVTINGSTEGVTVTVAVITYPGSDNYHGFTSLADAIEFAKTGNTITLIRDVTLSDILVINKAITLDGNGKTLTSTAGRAINVSGADGVTIKNLTVVASGERAINVIQNATNVTIDNVTATAANYTVNLASSAPNAVVAIKNSNLTGLNVVNVAAADAQVTVDETILNCADHNESEKYAVLALNKDAKGGSIVATNVTFNIEGDSRKATNQAQDGTVTIDGATDGVEVHVAYISYGQNWYGFATLEDAIAKVKDGETIELIRDVTHNYNARDAYKTEATKVVINGNGKTLTLNQKNSDWASFGLANNSKLVLNNMTIEKTGYGDTNGAWNTHAIIFSCPVEMTDVTVNNSVAVQDGAALTNVTINEANGYYGLWINGNGQTVTVNGGAINATNGGRGIKIADQYIDAPAQVTLSVDGTVFNTAKKAAVLVSSEAGAEITAANVNIEHVAEDSENFVWVDEDWAQHFGNVVVTGATVRAEGVAAFTAAITANGAVQAYYKTLAEAINAAQAGATVELLADVTLAGGYADAAEGLRIEKEITLNGNGYTINCGNFLKGIRVYNPSNVGDFNVNFNNVKVVNNVANGRCIDTRSGNINLKVNSSTLIATNGNSQPLTIGGDDPVHRVALNGTTIDAGTSGYAVISFVSTNVDINGANNSTISGFAAFYLKGDAKTTNLNLGQGVYTGTNNHAIESGAFGTVVLEGDNNVVNLMGTNATVKAIANNTAPQAAFLVCGANNTIKVTKESAKIITEGNAYEAMVKADNAATTKFVDMGIERKLVAENGGYQFYSFEEAVRFAGNEGTIKVVNDFELAEAWTVAAGQNITLDLNGKTVSYTSAVAGEDMITNRGNLTITDSSDAKIGKLTYVNTDATASNVTVSTISTEAGSTLVVDGGTIENKTVKTDGSSIYSFAIDILTNGNLGDVNVTINGGKVYSDYMAIRQFNNGTACKNSLTINGGHIYGAKRAVQVHMDNNAAVTAIKGGKVEAGADGYAICNFAATGNLEVTGGEFIGAVYSARENFISGGIYDAEVYAGYCAEGYMPNKNVDGTYGVVLVADAYASIDGVTYGSLKAAVAAAKAGETITLLQDVKENVTISKHLTINGAGKTIIGMITTDGKSLKVTIKNVNFDGNNKTVNYAMRADDDLNLVVENCSVKDYLYGFLYANKSNDKIVVKNVTVENCAEYGAYLVAFNSASFENFTVKGQTKYGVVVANAGARTVNFKNVSFEGAETPLHINELGTGKVTFKFSGINDMSKAEFYTSEYVNVVAAAQVGTKVCGSLNDAFAAAQTDDTVKMLSNLNLGWNDVVKTQEGYDVLAIVENKNIVLDMNEKKISVNHQSTTERIYSVLFVENGAGLTVTGNGSIDIDADDNAPKVAYMFWKRGTTGYLVIENGNFHMDNSEDSMIYANGGNIVTVNGGTFVLDANGTRVNGFPWIFNVAGNDVASINVNGGTYNYNIRAQFWSQEVKLGEGLTTTKNSDGTWTVVPGVAAVGEELFGSIQEAIDAAQDGETVTLVKDVVYNDNDVFVGSMNKTLVEVAGKNIVLDMNGKNIDVTYTGPNYLLSVIHVADGAGLTVTGEGSIDVKGLNADGTAAKNIAYVFYKSGTTGYLTIENGTFHMNDAADSMVYTNGDEIVTINGGTFILDAVASQTNGFPVIFSTQGNNERQIVVNAGTFNYDINHQIRPFEPYVAPEKAVKKVQIDGVDMWTIVPAEAYVTEMLGEWVTEPGNNEHKVGYATVAEAIAATNNLGKTVTILAGDYTGNLNVNKGITVQGETDENGNNLVTFNGKLNITADGATVKNINVNNGSATAAYIGAKDVVVDGCQVVGGNGFRSCYTSGTVTFKNSVITGATYGIHFDGSANGNIVIENCVITGWTSFASTITNVAIKDSKFAEGNYNQLRFYQNAQLTNCVFNENMTVDFGDNDNDATFEGCTVENGGALIDIIFIADVAEGNKVTIDGVEICVAAKINDTYYLSLQAAIDAATEGQTVTIVSDLTLTEGVTVAADKNLFIALNGKTITGTPAEAKAFAVITNRGTLTIQGDGAVVTDHQLAGSTGYAVNTITNCGTLTIDGATIENKSTAQYQIGYAIDNNSTSADAVVTVVSGKVTASGSLYYDGIRQFCNSTTVANDVIVRGGEVSTIWMQNPSDGATKNTKDVKGSVTIEGGNVGVLSLEPSANFEAAMTGGHVGEISYFQTATGRDLVQFVTGGTGTQISEDFLAYGYQLTGDAAPYEVKWTGFRKTVTFIDGQFTEYVNKNDIEVGALTYQRTFPTVWTPIYVPFEIPVAELAEQGFEVAYINGVRRDDVDEDGELDKFVMEVIYIHGGNADGSAKTLKANYPYFLRAKSAVTQLNLTLNGVTLHKSEDKSYDCTTMTEKFEIVGNNRKMTSDEFDGNMYVVGQDANGKTGWGPINNGSSLKPFRVYMTVTDRENAMPIDVIEFMSISIRGEELADGTTLIYDVEMDGEQSVDYIYDLQGRRVLEPQKGNLYIINGKKVIF